MIPGKLLCKWLKPSPITEFYGEFELEILPLRTMLSYKNPNMLPNLGRVSFNTLAKRFIRGNLAGMNEHYLRMLVQEWVPTAKGLTVIATKKDKTIWDGSHRLTALAIAKEKGRKVPTHVAVFFKKK